MDKYITKNKKETTDLAVKFAKKLRPGDVVLLYGDLGAGKTTFVQGVAKGLGVKDRIISPTFVLHRIHKVNSKYIKGFNHLDLYRIEDKLSLENLDLDEVFQENDSVTFIEWADRIEDLPNFNGYRIYFKHIDKNNREILIEKNDTSQLEKAIKILREGGIVVYPTDTAYGIGCRIDNEESIERLFNIRNRPQNKATPVLFDSIEMIEKYVLPIDPTVRRLMEKHWPGALTIVLKCKVNRVPGLVRGGGDSLGVRIPDHKIPQAIIKAVGVPIIGTSANFSGGPTPFSFDQLDKRLIKLVDLCMDGKTKGENQASTVVDCSVMPWKIVRQGNIVI